MLVLFAKVFFWIIGIMFFAGMAGSALVVVLTSIEDGKELREKREAEGSSRVMQDPHFGESFSIGTSHGH